MNNTTIRPAALAQLLRERRRHLQDEVRSGIREGRDEHPKEVGDLVEDSDAHVQGDIEFAVLQMKAGTLARVDEALLRLAAGHYGSCVTCGGEIPGRRLRALPFAVRCRSCEMRREQESGTGSTADRAPSWPSPLFPPMLAP